jgi:hypothetical protein
MSEAAAPAVPATAIWIWSTKVAVKSEPLSVTLNLRTLNFSARVSLMGSRLKLATGADEASTAEVCAAEKVMPLEKANNDETEAKR